MTRRYLISLLATNRIGVLPAITGAINELGGDMQEASQTVMQGFLTMVLAADFPPHRDPQVIVEHIQGIAKPFEMEVTVRELAAENVAHPPEETSDRFYLTLNGFDSPGLIRQVTSRLAGEGISITDLYAVREGRGEPVVMIFELAVPENADLAPLRANLEELGEPEELTAVLEHESVFTTANTPRPVRIAKAFEKETFVSRVGGSDPR